MGRGHVEHLHSPEVEPVDFGASCWPAETATRFLSRDADPNGGLTALLTLPAGYHRVAGSLASDHQFLIMSGSLWIGDTAHVTGYYEFHPSGSGMDVWNTTEPCELLIKIEGSPDLVAGEAPVAEGFTAVDTARMPWLANPVPGAEPGLSVKILRSIEETGEMTAIVSNPPRFRYPMLEFHDCVEEMFLIEGDMRLANSGVMVPGTYFWRPGYITHGPFYSHLGSLMFLFTSSTLVNHVPRDPASTPEENFAQAAEEGTQISWADAGW